ncbi:hypothetical protein SDC9_201251 [bioreactor metagenome]|uniref:Uncharacterized protein n=1 Tax=bioreactor metagenome TaxID=1076179 RepID=A0A645IQS0_9ZZZZ
MGKHGISVKFNRGVIYISPLIRYTGSDGERYVQLQRLKLPRNNGKAILAGNEGKGAAVVPFHLKLTRVVYEIDGSLSVGRHRGIGIAHLREPDAGAGRILLLHKFHPFGILSHCL